MRQCSWRIGTGSKVHVGSPLWIAPDVAPPNNTLVSQLTNGNGNWIEERVRLYYGEDKVSIILNTPLSKTGVDDIIRWNESSHGRFNVKADYLNQLNHVDNTTLDWKKFWKLPCMSKVLLFGWKCLVSALPLGRELLKKHFNIEDQCAFGCPITEDANHLFLHYPVSRCAWFGSALGIHSGVTHDIGFVNWLVTLFESIDDSTFTEKDFVRILVFSWSIYMHRNEVRFQNIAASPGSIINIWNRVINPDIWECRDLNYTLSLDRPNRTGFYNSRTHPDQEDILIGWKKDRRSRQNNIGVFHYFSNCAQLVFFYRENSTNPIPDSVLKGIRCYLLNQPPSTSNRRTLYLQGNLPSLKNADLGILAQNVDRLCNHHQIQVAAHPHNLDLLPCLTNIHPPYGSVLYFH